VSTSGAAGCCSCALNWGAGSSNQYGADRFYTKFLDGDRFLGVYQTARDVGLLAQSPLRIGLQYSPPYSKCIRRDLGDLVKPFERFIGNVLPRETFQVSQHPRRALPMDLWDTNVASGGGARTSDSCRGSASATWRDNWFLWWKNIRVNGETVTTVFSTDPVIHGED
jgi:hypothetical protein